MIRFKAIILPMQGQNKSNLHWLFNTRNENETEKIFSYNHLKFWFGGCERRNSEKLIMYVSFPVSLMDLKFENALPIENYLL